MLVHTSDVLVHLISPVERLGASQKQTGMYSRSDMDGLDVAYQVDDPGEGAWIAAALPSTFPSLFHRQLVPWFLLWTIYLSRAAAI
jgi:hypothetical protein